MIIEIKSKSIRVDDAVVYVVVDGTHGTVALVFACGRWVVDPNETRTWFSSSLAGLGFERLDALRRSVEKYMGSR